MKEKLTRENLFDVINFMEIKMNKNDEFFAFTYFRKKICSEEDRFTSQINIDNQDEDIKNFLDGYFKYLSNKYTNITNMSIGEAIDLLCENEKIKPSELFNIITWLKEEYTGIITVPAVGAYAVAYKTFDGIKKLTIGYPYNDGFKRCTDPNGETIPFKNVINVLEITPYDLCLFLLSNLMKF